MRRAFHQRRRLLLGAYFSIFFNIPECAFDGTGGKPPTSQKPPHFRLERFIEHLSLESACGMLGALMLMAKHRDFSFDEFRFYPFLAQILNDGSIAFSRRQSPRAASDKSSVALQAMLLQERKGVFHHYGVQTLLD